MVSGGEEEIRDVKERKMERERDSEQAEQAERVCNSEY